MNDDFALHPAPRRLLEGRRTLVTGAATGIGQGAAYELAAHGAAVAVDYRGKEDAANQTVTAIERAGGRAVAVQMDVASEDDVAHGFARARDALGGLDAPGAIETPINRDVLDDPEQPREVLEEIPLGRRRQVTDVAQAIAWAASDQASYVTGTTLFVDGGMTLYPRFV